MDVAALSVRAGEGEGGPMAREAGRGPLDQRGDNRFSALMERVQVGSYVIGPERSGGAFDPLGVRQAALYRANDVVAVCETLKGRWLFITLTIDRAKFLNAESAYLRCQERVRKVAGLLSRIWAATIEPQTKTGEGWIHWHLLVYVPNSTPLSQLRAVVERAWSIREVIADELVDRETGEVIARAKWARLSIGIVKVEEAGSISGTARYVAKYMVKAWPAVPTWMGESERRQRKLRLSEGFYEVLEKLHLHVRHRGGRKTPTGRRLKSRRLFDRMARSGARSVVFERTKHGLQFAGIIAMPLEIVVERGRDVRPLRLGYWGSVRVGVDGRELKRLREVADSAEGREETERYRRRKRLWLEVAWEVHQERRERDA